MNKRTISIGDLTVEVVQWGDTFEWKQDDYAISLLLNQGGYYGIHLEGIFVGYLVKQTDIADSWTDTWRAGTFRPGVFVHRCTDEEAAGWGQVGAAIKLLAEEL